MDDSKIKLTPDGKTVYEVYDVDNLVIPEGVTKIDKCAATQRAIVTVEIPDSVEEIGKEAFRICNYLQSVTIGAGVKKMGNEAFANCDNLTKVTIKEGVKTIGTYAFRHCKALTDITLPESLTKIGANAFSGCSLNFITIPAKVKTICEWAFGGNPLKSVTFANGSKLTTIEEYAFTDTAIETLVLPKRVKMIDKWAFTNCKNLKTVVLPDGIETFGKYGVFENCEALESINIPASLTDLGYHAFKGCTALKNITVDPANPAYVMKGGKLMTKDLKKQIFPVE